MKITVDEMKMRLWCLGNDLVDTYFPGQGMIEKTMSATAKYILKKNIYQLEPVLEMFADHDKMIDIQEIVDYYGENLIGEDGLKIDVSDWVKGTAFSSIIPKRILLLKKEDLESMISQAGDKIKMMHTSWDHANG